MAEPQPASRFQIPGAIRPASRSFNRSMLWLYGDTGVGKTTLANSFPGVWFFATEPGQEFIDMRAPTLLENWEHFIEICAGIEENKPTKFGDGESIQFLCIDTVDLLFRMCSDDVCQNLGIEDPAELPHGKAWGRLRGEFARVITKVRRWPYGLICISHERQKEFKTRGQSVNRYEPEIGAGGFAVLSAASDFIFRCYVDEIAEKDEAGNVTGGFGERRMLQCHPTARAVAKCRPRDQLPAHMAMDYDELRRALGGSDEPPTTTKKKGTRK